MNRDYLHEGLEGAEETEEQRTYLGVVTTQVVGIQHYAGHVSNREMILLRRQPANPYDANAIQVLNVQEVQVGHLPRMVAQHVAPVLDNGDLLLEGLVPRGSKNKYKMPVNLFVYARSERTAAVRNAISRAGLVIERGVAAEHTLEVQRRKGQPVAHPVSKEAASDFLSRMFDDILSEEAEARAMPAAAAITTPLLAHQREALAWMVERENNGALPPFWEPHKPVGGAGDVAYCSTLTNFVTATRPAPFRGGILADDMGLGKTLTVLALVATNRPGATLPEVLVETRGDPEVTGTPSKRKRRSTAAASPAAASPAAACGSQASTSSATTAAELSAEKPRKLTAAQRALQEAADAAAPAAGPPAEGSPTATLIVCPVSVMSNWEAQLNEHSDGSLTFCLYHGSGRYAHKPAALAKTDVVVTTYGCLVADASLLGKVKWLRVVLDEGHFIKNSETQQSAAAASLDARARWIVSGTPIQNSMRDLFGLVAFLHLTPLSERPVFRATFERPMATGDKAALLRLKVLMAATALRRLKTTEVRGKPLVALPPKHIEFVDVELEGEHRGIYDRWERAGREAIVSQLESDTLLRNYSSVLEIILRSRYVCRLRQICDHPSLCPKEPPAFLEGAAAPHSHAADKPLSSAERQALIQKLMDLIASGAQDECPICMDDVKSAVITTCGHVFCRGCIENWLINESAKCPLCRADITKAALLDAPQPEAEAGSDTELAKPDVVAGAKVERLLAQLRANEQEHVAAGRPGGPKKSVVFSQFTTMLTLVERQLRAAGIEHVRIDGSVPAAKRKKVLQAFASTAPDSPRVAVVSLKAGGVGLNLVSACQVHLLDPWWNPATEDQAMDRVHRIGQQREVRVFRYICRDTIEERMLELQNRKRELAERAFERRRPEAQQAARLADVKLLMAI